MEITNELVDKLAHLSKLSFNNTEKESIKADLSKMIGFIEQLQQIDTQGVEPLQHMSDAVNVLRKDEQQGSISQQDGLLNAPKSDGKYFMVPKVIKK
ncbi:MAG: Asp-tRNA(Asn)/Glu-tRNA(Gln) amidotransferase subunit GatC [Chitinophagaceae bacterium]|jgi:aspartyl-tRNA(Asn)/glutamyl-tRNA(Gln) amidotransferase subunit C